MATNVSSLRVAIRGDVSGLEASLDRGQKSVTSFQRKFVQSQRSTAAASSFLSGGGGRSSMIISQLGFAAEDAAVSFGNQGLAGALRAAGNNLSFVASMLNPMAGLAVGVGTALGAILIPKLFETGEAAEDATDRIKGLRDAMEGLRNVRDRFSTGELEERAVDLPNLRKQLETDDLDSIREQQKRSQDNLRRLQIQEADIRKRSAGVLSILGLGDETIRMLGGGANPLAALREIQRTNPQFEEAAPEVRAQLARLETERQKLIDQARQEQQRLKALDDAEQAAARTGAAAMFDALRSGAGGLLMSALNAKIPRDMLPEPKELRQSPRSQGLAGGFEFGSREAISALNRAAFSSTTKTEERIEKNTGKTEIAVRDVVKAVRDLGSQFVPALAGDPL